MIFPILLFLLTLSGFAIAYPNITTPSLKPASYVFIQGHESSTLVVNGAFVKNITNITLGGLLVNASSYTFLTDPCRKTTNRSRGCGVNIKSVWGSSITGASCESALDYTKTCIDEAYFDGYDPINGCDVITPINACHVIRCITMSSNLPVCYQYGIGGTLYNVPNYGLECDTYSACNENGICSDARGDECNTAITYTNPFPAIVGLYDLVVATPYGQSIIANYYEIIPVPLLSLISTISNNSTMHIIASPTAGFSIQYYPLLLSGITNVYYKLTNATSVDSASFTSNFASPFTFPGNAVVRGLTMYFDYKNYSFSVPLDVNITIAKVPTLFSLCPGIALAFTRTVVVVLGIDFYNSTLLTCLFGGEIVPVVYVSQTTVNCIVNPINGSQHLVEVYISNDGGNVYSPQPLEVRVLGSCDVLKPNSVPVDAKCVCQPGYRDATYACVPCELGTYQPSYDQSICVLCDSSEVTVTVGNTNSSSCECKEGRYRKEPTDYVCALCPDGFSCENNTLTVLPGYWRASASSNEAIVCTIGQGCAGGVAYGDYSCKTGYKGPVCSVCDAGYGRFGVDCVECNGRDGDRMILVVLLGVTCVLLYLLIRLTTDPPKHMHATDIGVKQVQGNISTVVKILLSYLQILYYIGNMSASWSRDSVTFFNIFIPLSVSPSFVAVQCAGGSNFQFYQHMILVMLLPLIIAGSLVVVFVFRVIFAVVFSRNPPIITYAAYVKCFLIILYVFFPMIAHQLLRGLKCVSIHGLDDSYLQDDMSVSCTTPTYMVFKVIAILYLFGFVIYLPLMIGRAMHKERVELIIALEAGTVHDDWAAFLYFARGFANHALLWEGVVMYTKLAVVATSLISEPILQLVWCGVVLFIATMATFKYKPYRLILDNQLALISLFALVMSVILAIHSSVIGTKAGKPVFALLVIVNSFAILAVFKTAWQRIVRMYEAIERFVMNVLERLGFGDDSTSDGNITMYSANSKNVQMRDYPPPPPPPSSKAPIMVDLDKINNW